MDESGPFIIGAALRPTFRRNLFTLGLTYREDKGLFDSVYYVHGPIEQRRQLIRWVQHLMAEDAAEEAAAAERAAHPRWWQFWRKQGS